MKKIGAISGFLLAIVTLVSYTSAADPDYSGTCNMMYGLNGGYGSGVMIFTWITYILVIALIIAGIYWLIKSASKKR